MTGRRKIKEFEQINASIGLKMRKKTPWYCNGKDTFQGVFLVSSFKALQSIF